MGEISKRVRNNDGRMNLPLLTISARYGWMTQQSRFSASIAGREKKNYTLLKKHQLSYNHGNSKVANYGTVYELTDYDEALVPKVYHSFSLTSENSSKFIESYFHTKKLDAQLRKFIASTARMDGLLNISFDDFMKVKLFAPERCEQSKISRIINLIEKLITLQQRKLELLKEIKKGLLQKMFADKSKFPILRFEGFHNEWEQRKLKNVYQKIGNAFVGTASPYYVDAGHFYLESNNIKNGQINRNHEVFINNSFYQKQSNKLLHTGDLVMVQSGHVGDTAVITQEYNNSAAHALIVFRNPKDKFLSDYLNFYFQNTSAKNKINILAIGNTIRHVLASDMSRFSVYFPNKDERKYISNLLLKLQYTITLQQSKISQLTILKKYLLQKLFI
ncbi:restriction endonuclease subunit S [Limosilactobacillus reuteri]|uniref:Type I restriction-modification system, specificity subunit S n=2 Tax=Limosilactobacillus reuteri TaxID=1598 RepID=A0A0U5JHN0_LIMRT|nr:Type I restriction-modification system, specificity subunit S [Limosilactobacillus reuteri]